MSVTKKSSKTKRVESAKDLAKKVKRAKTLIFANYHGLTVNQIADLRGKIKSAGGELLVAKNTLLSRALSINHLPFTINQLTGPTAAILAYQDEIAPVKAAAEFIKTLGLPKFKFAFFGKDFLDAVALETLSKIPSRNVLQAKVVGAIASPLYGFVSVLQANIRSLVSVLDQKAKQSDFKFEI